MHIFINYQIQQLFKLHVKASEVIRHAGAI